MILAAKIGDARWILAQQVGQGTPKAFVALLVFWLTLLFASFALFAPPNFTSAATLTLCAPGRSPVQHPRRGIRYARAGSLWSTSMQRCPIQKYSVLQCPQWHRPQPQLGNFWELCVFRALHQI